MARLRETCRTLVIRRYGTADGIAHVPRC
jgi:hypothetical protein